MQLLGGLGYDKYVGRMSKLSTKLDAFSYNDNEWPDQTDLEISSLGYSRQSP